MFTLMRGKAAKLLIPLALVSSGCGAGSGSDASADFWETFRPSGVQEVEGYDSLAEMSSAADSVVTAVVQSVELGRFVEDESGDRLYFANVSLTQVGDQQSKSRKKVILELPIVGPAAETVSRTNALPRLALPAGPGLYILRAKADAPGYFRPVTLAGVWIPGPAGSTAPLSETDVASELADGMRAKQATTVDELAALVEVG